MIGRFSELGVYRNLLRSWDFFRIALAGGLAGASYLWDALAGQSTTVGAALALTSVTLNGVPIVWGALRGLIRRRMNVDELVALAIVASLAKGEFLTAATVSFVMVLGALIEEATSDSARRAIEALIEIAPETATVLVDGQPRTVRTSEVAIGDLLLVKPGQRIPADGVVRRGVTSVDESSMTGEPIPLEKAPGDAIYAGTLNQNGVIEVEVTRVGDDSTLGKVIRLVSDAEAHKPQAVRTIDRYARWFTPAILTCSALTWWLTDDLGRAITVLIVGCPCALILAAPTAIVAAIGRAAKSGILIKGGAFLEEAGRADTVLFDKTGTLTEGRPRVDDITAADGVEPETVLSMAASVEQNSTHPLARAVLDAASEADVPLLAADGMVTRIGLGVRAHVAGRLIEVGSVYLGGGSMNVPAPLLQTLEQYKATGATPLVVYRDGEAIGILSVADHVRPEAKDTVDRLRDLGIERIALLSGDHEVSASMVAEAVGLTGAHWQLKPDDKLDIIKTLQASGHGVVFIGDGINDAPALAAANVGVAMAAAGTDVALETADIALMHDRIEKVPFIILLGRKTLRIIKWNIAFSLAFNLLAVLASGAGFLSPIMGAVVHNVGSVLVVISSASIAFASE